MAASRANNKEILGLHAVPVIDGLYGDRIGRPARGCMGGALYDTAVDGHLYGYMDS